MGERLMADLEEPRCFTRRCANFTGVGGSESSEAGEVPVCRAFPRGIPDEIAYGGNLHLVPLPRQGNRVVYEPPQAKGPK